MVAVLKILALLALGYGLLAGMMFLNQGRLIYLPSTQVTATPADAGLAFEDVELRTEDGVRLHGWFVPGPRPEDPVLLFLHGNAGNIGHRLHSLLQFHQLGLAVLIIDYRGYGHSTGRPHEEGTYLDARAAWDHLVADRGVEPQRIVVFGRSLGAAVAADLANRVDAGAVILESAFTSAADLGAHHYPWLPVRLLLRHEYDTLQRVGTIRSPLLIAHSRDDALVPFADAERLQKAAGDARLLPMQGGHNDGFRVSAGTYRQGIARFLQDAGVLEKDG